jgi:uncharacterized membrane protein
MREAARHRPGLEEMVVMMSGLGGGWSFWEVALMLVGMAVVLGAVIWMACAAPDGSRRWPGRERRTLGAREILDGRLASGEIDGAEYKRLRGLVSGSESRASAGTRNRRG